MTETTVTEKSPPEKSPPEKFPPEKFPPEKFPTEKFPTGKSRAETQLQSAGTGAAAKELAERNRHPLLVLRDEFDRLFDEASSLFRFPWGGRRSGFDLEPLLRLDTGLEAIIPPADVDEREGEYRLTVELPGMNEKDIQVSLQDDVLTIKAEKKEEKEEKSENRYVSERRYGMCVRSFRLPSGVDADRISAAARNGVLTVTLPKTEPNAPSKRTIDVAKA